MKEFYSQVDKFVSSLSEEQREMLGRLCDVSTSRIFSKIQVKANLRLINASGKRYLLSPDNNLLAISEKLNEALAKADLLGSRASREFAGCAAEISTPPLREGYRNVVKSFLDNAVLNARYFQDSKHIVLELEKKHFGEDKDRMVQFYDWLADKDISTKSYLPGFFGVIISGGDYKQRYSHESNKYEDLVADALKLVTNKERDAGYSSARARFDSTDGTVKYMNVYMATNLRHVLEGFKYRAREVLGSVAAKSKLGLAA